MTTQETTQLTLAEQRKQTLEQHRLRVLDRYSPVGNVHKPELEIKQLSVSKLVSMSAVDYAEYITAGSPDDGDPFYAFKGNTQSDAALVDCQSHEMQFLCEVPFSKEHDNTPWMLSGHCDGIDATPAGVIVHEHKAYGKPTPKKREIAKRQAMLYLSMGYGMARAGVRDLKPASYKDNGQTFHWPDPTTAAGNPLGVVISIAPEIPPPTSDWYEVTHDQAVEHLNFYLSKASFIVRAVQKGDMSIAKQWDDSAVGLSEQRLDFGQGVIGNEEAAKVMARYRELTATESTIKDEKEDLKAKIMQWLQANGNAKKLAVGNYQAQIIDMPAKQVNFKANSQLRVYG